MREYEHPIAPAADAAPAYMVLDGSLTLAGPVEDVWPIVLDFPGWQDFSSSETVSGTPGAVREVTLLKKEEPGLESFPPYYARTVKIVPRERIIWKTFPQRSSADDPTFFGIVDFRLEPRGNETLFIYNVFYEFVVNDLDETEAIAYENEMTANFGQMMASVFPKLVRLCEGSA